MKEDKFGAFFARATKILLKSEVNPNFSGRETEKSRSRSLIFRERKAADCWPAPAGCSICFRLSLSDLLLDSFPLP
jgi:hypothetical protein